MPAELVYSHAQLARDVASLRARLPFARLFYAMKACADVPVLAALRDMGVGFEAASIEEFETVVSLGVDVERVICGLPRKGPAFVRRLGAVGCGYFVFDCPEEYAALSEHAPGVRKLLRIHIADLDRTSAGWGMQHDRLLAWLRGESTIAHAIDGLTFHLARNYRVSVLERVFDRVQECLGLLGGGRPLVLNIGGGYRPILPAHLNRKYQLDAFYEVLAGRIAALAGAWELEIFAEPGRGMVESAGRLRTLAMQVCERAPTQIEVALELNIGVRPGAHPTEIAVLTDHGREVVYDLEYHLERPDADAVMCSFIDATCEYEEFYRLPLRRPIQAGERLEFVGVGAYTSCLSSRFHGRAPPSVRIEET